LFKCFKVYTNINILSTHTTNKNKNQDGKQKKVFLSFQPLQDESKHRNGRALFTEDFEYIQAQPLINNESK